MIFMKNWAKLVVFPVEPLLISSQQWWLLRSEEHTSELQSQSNLVCRLLLEKKKIVVSIVLLIMLISLLLYSRQIYPATTPGASYSTFWTDRPAQLEYPQRRSQVISDGLTHT